MSRLILASLKCDTEPKKASRFCWGNTSRVSKKTLYSLANNVLEPLLSLIF